MYLTKGNKTQIKITAFRKPPILIYYMINSSPIPYYTKFDTINHIQVAKVYGLEQRVEEETMSSSTCKQRAIQSFYA